MITEFFVQGLVFFLWIPILILKAINFVIPDFIYDGLTWAFQYFRYADGVLPLFARPEMTGPIASYGIIDILVTWFQLIFWFFIAKIIFAYTKRLTGVNIKK